jgi:hypothetical protein
MDVAAGFYLSEAQSPPKVLFGVDLWRYYIRTWVRPCSKGVACTTVTA